MLSTAEYQYSISMQCTVIIIKIITNARVNKYNDMYNTDHYEISSFE